MEKEIKIHSIINVLSKVEMGSGLRNLLHTLYHTLEVLTFLFKDLLLISWINNGYDSQTLITVKKYI